jgi:Uma2 family endonuclease
MAQSIHRVRYTRAEYIALERMSNVRHEYVDGVIYAMSGGTREHAAIAANVTAALVVALRGRPCAVHSSDLRIRVVDTGLDTYADVSVICGRPSLDAEDPHVVTNPIVLVEVTSPSTVEYDHGEKLAHYKRVPSLREVVFVSHREKMVEVIRREDDGTWTRHEARSGAVAELLSLGCSLSVDDVYRDPLALEDA